MQHRIVGWVCVTLALGISLACGGGDRNKDTTRVDTGKAANPQAAVGAARPTPPPGCQYLPAGDPNGDPLLPVILKGEDDYACVQTVAGTEGTLQTPTMQTIAQNCSGAQLSVTTALYPNAGSLSDKSGGDYKGHPAFVVGMITNNSPCDYSGKHVTLAKNTSYYIVVYGNGAHIYLVPPAGSNEKMKFKSCDDDGQGGTTASGDLAYLKEDGVKCQHTDTRHFVDIDDAGVLWLACAVDCCYASDPGQGNNGRGGRGGRGAADSTAPAAAAPKKKA
jgi:hypothetical protein